MLQLWQERSYSEYVLVEEKNHGKQCRYFKSEEEWDAEALFAAEEDEIALTAIASNLIDYEKDWIVDLGCSNHMTGDREKLQNLSEYKGSHVVVIANNSKLLIAHIDNMMVCSQYNATELPLQNVYHVPGASDEGTEIRVILCHDSRGCICRQIRKNETTDLWHMRLGHVSYSKLDVMMKRSMLKGLPQLEKKSKTLSKFKEFKEVVEAKVSKRVCCLRTDNGREYTSDEFSDFLQKCRICHQFTCSSTSQQNGIAERKNRYLAKICQSMLYAKNVPRCFWVEAMKTAAFVINRLPQQSKMDKKAIRCIFVRYDSQKKGWRCCDPTIGKCYTSWNVVFDEASLWWSSNKEVLPESDVFKDVLESPQIQIRLGKAEDADNGDIEEGIVQNPWQTGVYQQPNGEVGVMSRHMQSSKKPHLEAIWRVMRYVKSTLGYGIMYKRGGDCKLVGYYDTDYVGDHDTHRSTTGLIQHYNQELQKQPNCSIEFNSFPDPRWDPPVEHVGININSLSSTTYTRWNVSSHSGDPIDVWITHNATTKNLIVSWKYQTTSTPQENTSISYIIDLRDVLPMWVTVGFSTAPRDFIEGHAIQS
ncbi:hypothetical protein GH714_016626 [Hevea brasiliensis]|uniref:Integrase catalytic domain-containing protein n=1 Tax=Hevea brasiliensis TaxID=3981 RepID=A0A6A6K5Q8_HEVBR|nr:hypothetical protein GH714_016626 [Hevea brasiliensis]